MSVQNALLDAGHLEGPCVLELLIGYDGALDVETVTVHGEGQWLVVAEESDLGLAGGYGMMEEEFCTCRVCVCV